MHWTCPSRPLEFSRVSCEPCSATIILPLRVASARNVTRDSGMLDRDCNRECSFERRSNEHSLLRRLIAVGRQCECVRRCSSRFHCVVNQLLGHHVPPLTNSPLKCSELAVGEPPGMEFLQTVKQRFTSGIRFFLYP